MWMKRGALSNGDLFSFVSTTGAAQQAGIQFDGNNNIRWWQYAAPSYQFHKITTAVFRDPSAWYHIVFVYDTTLATAADRCQVWVNGIRQTAFSTSIDPSLNLVTYYKTGTLYPHIGGENRNASSVNTPFDGYLTEINFIDGQALTPSSFGETNPVTGVWSPKKYIGTYGTNGFYLNFSDNSNNTAATIGKDYSGNGNNWTPNNISVTAGVTYDSMLDVPTQWADGGNGRGNYCVLNPLDTSQNGSAGTLTNGNLTRSDSTATNTATFGTMFVSSGQWYYELLVQAISATTANLFAGIMTNNKSVFVGLRPNGTVLNCTTPDSGTYTTNDVLGVAVDIGANRVYVYKNGTLIHTLTPTTALTDFTPSIADGTGATGAVTASFNFGQRPFAYTPPTGFLALNTLNLPTPTILKGNQFFDARTYTGTGTTVKLTGVAADLVWLKNRGAAASHGLADSVRGGSNALYSNLTNAETTDAIVFSFDTDGVTLGGSGNTNVSGNSYVGWLWKEGPTQGFDIVTYTGTGANRTVAHSLGVAPRMMIVKNRTTSGNWPVYHASIGATNAVYLNQTNASAATSTAWNNTAPTSSVFSLGTSTLVNGSGDNYVAYLFSEVAGFSRAFSYTGNGSADGPFIFTGFRPRFVMVKVSSAVDNWWIQDTSRSQTNVSADRLFPNLSNAEAVNSVYNIDFLSNGFKIRGTGTATNDNGATYIGFAFAENPFKNSLAR
jgi:hypothetical protein